MYEINGCVGNFGFWFWDSDGGGAAFSRRNHGLPGAEPHSLIGVYFFGFGFE